MQLQRLAWLVAGILLLVRGPEPEDDSLEEHLGEAPVDEDESYIDDGHPEPEEPAPRPFRPVGLDPLPEESDPVEEDLSSDQVHKIFNKIDDNQDGKLSIEELMEFGQHVRRVIADQKAYSLLEDIDENRDQKISLDEFSENMHRLAEYGFAEDDDREHDDDAHTEKFEAADRDSNGGLDRDELPGMLNPALDDDVLIVHAKAKLETLDRNGDGKLTEDEFAWETAQLHGDPAGPEQEEEARDRNSFIFDRLDRNHDGVLSSAEMVHWASGLFSMDEAMKHLIEVADKNHDKKITLEELDRARSKIWGTSTSRHIAEWCDHYEL